MTVIYANVECLTASKASILSVMCKEQHCHCLCLKETHRSKDQARPRLPGMALVAERAHNKHGSSVFIRDGLKVNNISVCEEGNVQSLQWRYLVLLYTPCTKHHMNLSELEISTVTVHSGDTPQQTATENLWSNRRTQTSCHSYTTQNYRNHTTVQYGRRDTTRISSLYLQTFRICVRNRF